MFLTFGIDLRLLVPGDSGFAVNKSLHFKERVATRSYIVRLGTTKHKPFATLCNDEVKQLKEMISSFAYGLGNELEIRFTYMSYKFLQCIPALFHYASISVRDIKCEIDNLVPAFVLTTGTHNGRCLVEPL